MHHNVIRDGWELYFSLIHKESNDSVRVPGNKTARLVLWTRVNDQTSVLRKSKWKESEDLEIASLNTTSHYISRNVSLDLHGYWVYQFWQPGSWEGEQKSGLIWFNVSRVQEIVTCKPQFSPILRIPSTLGHTNTLIGTKITWFKYWLCLLLAGTLTNYVITYDLHLRSEMKITVFIL